MHDSRLRHQPNAVNNVQDCRCQMSALAAMRTIAPLFFRRDFHRGPFVFTLTDLHQSNIFVDDAWRITCLVDLEGACCRAVQMVEPPHWLTNKGVDEIGVEEYDKLRTELLIIMNAEETEQSSSLLSKDTRKTPLRLSKIMEEKHGRRGRFGNPWHSPVLPVSSVCSTTISSPYCRKTTQKRLGK